jgi:hypothetical protein
MNEAQLRPYRPRVKHQLDPILISAALDDVIAELARDRLDLRQVCLGNPTPEFRGLVVHENGEHADLDALIKILAPAWKP